MLSSSRRSRTVPESGEEPEGPVKPGFARPGGGPLPADGGHSGGETGAQRDAPWTVLPQVGTPGRVSGSGHDFAESVRRELQAAGGRVEPSPDGLERIREKIYGQSAG